MQARRMCTIVTARDNIGSRLVTRHLGAEAVAEARLDELRGLTEHHVYENGRRCEHTELP